MFDRTIIVYGIVVLAFFSLFQGVSMLVEKQPVAGSSLRRRTLADGFSPWFADVVVRQRIRDFEALVGSSGIHASPAAVLAGMATATLAVLLGVHFLKFSPLYSFAAGIMLGMVLPLLVIHVLRRRRMAALVSQLPDALDMLVRSLRVGHPVPIGISMIGSEMPNPIGGEFKQVFDSMSYGLDLKDALENLSARLHIPEITYMVAAIRIQYATGGNLAEVLASLADVMRARVRLKMKVKAVSAESRFSAAVMSLMPFLLVGGLLLIHPDLYKDVPTSRPLQEIMGGAAALLVTGILLMRRLINIRV